MADDLKATIFEVTNPVSAERSGSSPAVTGWISLVASEAGLRLLTLPAPSYEAALRRLRQHYPGATLASGDPVLLDIAWQVRAYLCGELQEFDVQLDLSGHSAFELGVWAAALRIPYGQTRTYAWIAAQVGGGPTAAQAAGAALGDNPVPLIIPCHRVLGSDGSLHGFAGGLDMKAKLLALESGQQAFEW
jgi:O-6-methylguanine DNA methyltransferase